MRVCFTGCSFTAGAGFDEADRDQFIYDRLLSRELGWQSQNLAQPGNSNYRIFIQSLEAITSGQFDWVMTQWSAVNRLWLSPAPNIWHPVPNKPADFHHKNLKISKSNIEFFNDMVLLLNHDYQNILDLVDYSNVLGVMAKQHRITHVNINGLIPWQSDLVLPFGTNLAEEFSHYTKQLLDFSNRPDAELKKLFGVLQKKVLSLDQSTWVNLFDSFKDNTVDLGPQGHHPGPISHQWMAQRIRAYLIKENMI